MARRRPLFALSVRGWTAWLFSLLLPAALHAQEPLRAVVFRTGSAAADMDVAAAVDPLVLAEINQRSDLRVVERPALDLQATQIAIDCVGETAACLIAVLRQYAEASVLIAPSIQRADEETVVTFLYFDPHGAGEFRTVVGRYRGEDVAHQALDSVPSMLRALLNPSGREPDDAAPSLAPAAPLAEPASAEPASAAHAGTDHVQSAIPWAPIALLASGVVIAGVGIAFGAAANHSEQAYRAADTHDDRAIDHAIALRDRAHREAWVANISYGVATAVLAVGATLLVVDLSDAGDTERTTLSASLGPNAVGLALSAHLPRSW